MSLVIINISFMALINVSKYFFFSIFIKVIVRRRLAMQPFIQRSVLNTTFLHMHVQYSDVFTFFFTQ